MCQWEPQDIGSYQLLLDMKSWAETSHRTSRDAFYKSNQTSVCNIKLKIALFLRDFFLGIKIIRLCQFSSVPAVLENFVFPWRKKIESLG